MWGADSPVSLTLVISLVPVLNEMEPFQGPPSSHMSEARAPLPQGPCAGYSHLVCLSHRADARMSHSRIVPLLLLYTKVLQ